MRPWGHPGHPAAARLCMGHSAPSCEWSGGVSPRGVPSAPQRATAPDRIVTGLGASTAPPRSTTPGTQLGGSRGRGRQHSALLTRLSVLAQSSGTERHGPDAIGSIPGMRSWRCSDSASRPTPTTRPPAWERMVRGARPGVALASSEQDVNLASLGQPPDADAARSAGPAMTFTAAASHAFLRQSRTQTAARHSPRPRPLLMAVEEAASCKRSEPSTASCSNHSPGRPALAPSPARGSPGR